MSSTSLDARTLTKEIKKLPRSVRSYIPLIATRIGSTPGIVTHYMDGFGSDPECMKAILAEARAILSSNNT